MLSNPNSIRWTQEEDKILLMKMREFGQDWDAISHFLPLRSPASIQARWQTSIQHRTQPKHFQEISQKRPWTNEENDLLIQKIREFGLNWNKVSAFFPDRNVEQLQVHYLIITESGNKIYQPPPRIPKFVTAKS